MFQKKISSFVECKVHNIPVSIVFSMLQKKTPDIDRGRIKLKTMYDKCNGILLIEVGEAIGLQQMHPHEQNRVFVRILFLPNESEISMKLTNIAENSDNPYWYKEFDYKIGTPQALQGNRALEVSVWNYSSTPCNEFMGVVRLGPLYEPRKCSGGPRWMDCSYTESVHWNEMIANAGTCIEAWHDLRQLCRRTYKKQGNDDYEVGNVHYVGVYFILQGSRNVILMKLYITT